MGLLTLLFDHLLIVGGVLVASLSVVLVLTQRRSPQSALAWLLAFVLIPYVAVPVFLALGFRKQGSRYPSIRFGPPAGTADVPAPHPLADVFHRLGAPPATTGNSVQFHAGPLDAREALHKLIESAAERLDVVFYILEDDAIGRAFVDALTARVRDGIKVRLLLDRVGTLSRPRSRLAEFEKAGGELLFFSPFLHPLDRGHMNLRNHRKMLVADGKRAWTGGRNVGRHYLASDAWVDLSCTLEGSIVSQLQEVFETNWAISAGSTPKSVPPCAGAAGNSIVQLVASGPDEPLDAMHNGLVHAIHAAKTRVWIATPYYVPTEILSHAIITAARRGIDVRILVPKRSNKRLTDFARGAYLRSFEKAGGTVLRVPGRKVHAKMGVIDDAAWLGTVNFDVRSMLLNFETMQFFYDDDAVGQLVDWFDRTSQGAEIGMPKVWMMHRVLEGLFRLGSPIL